MRLNRDPLIIATEAGVFFSGFVELSSGKLAPAWTTDDRLAHWFHSEADAIRTETALLTGLGLAITLSVIPLIDEEPPQ